MYSEDLNKKPYCIWASTSLYQNCQNSSLSFIRTVEDETCKTSAPCFPNLSFDVVLFRCECALLSLQQNWNASLKPLKSSESSALLD
mmetsp:Transcript_19343/g.29135  ORF Transcript_19343/g.29135 Transcript_19343/m.29135 type:complete len:87 (-) Transcript_19343:400-660(-)